MDVKIKALIVLLPFAISGYVGFANLQPVLDDLKVKDETIGTKTTENNDLVTKLEKRQEVSARETQLKQEIEKLRDSVPKSPDTDLLAIDLEKMCKDAGMNMIGLTTPKLEGKPRNIEESTSQKKDKLKNMLKGGAGATAGEKQQANVEGAPSELEQSQKQFIVSGDYGGLQKLVHELETYQRVLHIDDLSFHLPRKASAKDKVVIEDGTPSEGEECGDPRLLFITMTVTTYFLP
jgi:hypothetical protein